FAPALSRSTMTTFAPPSAKRFAMPSPNPEPAPVMSATLPSSDTVISLTVIHGNRLQRGEPIERLEALFTAMAGFLHAAEGQFDAATGPIIVDEHLTGMDGARQAELTSAIIGPDAADEAIMRAIGNRDG